MSFNFHTYLKAKNNFCYIYNGIYNEFVWQLLQVRKYAKLQYPNVNIFINCHLEINEEHVIKPSQMKDFKFLKTEEILFDMKISPILNIFKNSNIKIKKELIADGKKCHLIDKVKPPFKSLGEKNLQQVKNYLMSKYELVNKEDADILVGVECEELYKWAYLGKRTILLNFEENEIVYKNLFPYNEILNLDHI